MSLDAALQQHCLDDAGLRALVGRRVFPDFAPAIDPDTRLPLRTPYVVRSLISNPRQEHLGGEAGIGNPTYQFTVLAGSSPERDAVAEALRSCLSCYDGPMGGEDVSVSAPDEGDDVETANDGSDRRVFTRRMDFEIYHSREPVRRHT